MLELDEYKLRINALSSPIDELSVAMDIDGISEQTMVRFINDGYIREFADLYHLPEHFEEISKMDGFGEKSCLNMSNALEKSKKVHPVNFIYALCIPMIGN